MLILPLPLIDFKGRKTICFALTEKWCLIYYTGSKRTKTGMNEVMDMKDLTALLLAALLLFSALPPAVHAAPAVSEGTVLPKTQVQLNEVQTDILELLKTALRERREGVDLSGFSIQLPELLDVLNELLWDPEFFYYDYPAFEVSSDGAAYIELHYREEYGPAEMDAFEQAVQRALSAVLPGMSDLQTALVLHDYLALNAAYDSENFRSGTVPESAYNAYGALVLGTAVCEGYADAYQLLLGRCGIDAVTVASLAMDHGWNLVDLGGSWYHVDVTWDDPVPDALGRADHSFFLLSDSAIAGRDSSSGGLHYDWDGNQACSDDSYDGSPFWSGLEQPVIFTDADTAWYIVPEGEGRSHTLKLVRRDWESGEESAAASVRDYWPVWGRPDAYWDGAYSGMCVWNGQICFNDSLHIYGYDPATGNIETVMTYGGGDGYLYGLASDADGLRYRVAEDPMDRGSIHTLAPGVKTEEAGSEAASGREDPFADVSVSDYFYDAVLWAYENNVTTGTSATEFSPASTCTRGQVVTFLWRTAGCPMPSGHANPFADVPEDAYFRDAVLWAVERGITNGVGSDPETGGQLFGPGQTCSYAHILTFLWRSETGKTSGTAGVWYADALRWARDSGLLTGTLPETDGEAVGADCPRCDVVTYLWRNSA